MMNKLVMDFERKSYHEPRLIVPCKDNKFPYVFSVNELEKWENKGYLSEVCSICEKYYRDEDDVQLSVECKFSLNANLNQVCVCSIKEFYIFEMITAKK